MKKKDIKFSVRDHVLKVSSWNKVLRFGRKGKLSPGFIRPYRILKRIGLVAYQLELPSKLDHIQDVLHVSMLRWYRSGQSHVILIKEIELRLNLSFEKEPIQILEHEIKVLR